MDAVLRRLGFITSKQFTCLRKLWIFLSLWKHSLRKGLTNYILIGSVEKVSSGFLSSAMNLKAGECTFLYRKIMLYNYTVPNDFVKELLVIDHLVTSYF